jgi:excisionase family DNA binding protein
MMKEDSWVGISEGVHLAGGLLSYWALYSMVIQNRLESRRVGRHWQVREESLKAYLRGQKGDER